MKIDPNTKAFKLVKFQALYHVFQVSCSGKLLQLTYNNGNPVLVRSVIDLREKLGIYVSKGKIEEAFLYLPIGF